MVQNPVSSIRKGSALEFEHLPLLPTLIIIASKCKLQLIGIYSIFHFFQWIFMSFLAGTLRLSNRMLFAMLSDPPFGLACQRDVLFVFNFLRDC